MTSSADPASRTSPSAADLVARLEESRPCRDLRRVLSRGDTPPAVGGVPGALLAVLAGALVRDPGRPLLMVVPGDEEAEGLAGDLALLDLEAAHLPAGDTAPGGRLRLARALARGAAPRVVTASVRSVLDPVPSPEELAQAALKLQVGAELDRDHLVGRLAEAGFEPVDRVDRPGTYSPRGDVVDLYPSEESSPLRAEFFGDVLEGLRRFDMQTQLSVEVLQGIELALASGTGGAAGILDDLLPADTLLLTRDEARLEEALQRNLASHEDEEAGTRASAWKRLMSRPRVRTSRLKLPAGEASNLGGRVIAPDGTGFEEALRTLGRIARGAVLTLLVFEGEAERRRFFEAAGEALGAPQGKDLPDPAGLKLVVREGALSEGFHAPFLGIAAVAHQELFARPRPRRAASATEGVESRPLDSFLELNEGDHVVHLVHGIGRFEGLERVEQGGGSQDFLALAFRDNVRVLVPVVRIDLVQKYVGGRGETPELSRVGGRSWQRRKEAASRAVGDLAAELLEVQALRARSPGIAHPGDTPWQQEFEAAFPHPLTADQQRAVEAIKTDMERPRPMDRLLCGDVGFGKTEVALRAAFKSFMGGRQVAVLVPTTVLARQHAETFRRRLVDYPVVVEDLSRFRTRREQDQVLAALADGSVDVVIGTHRLLQPDVAFADLGLVVIDEEQRFGVGHKEQLRRLRREVDVLTLSATPIPRTLHQALLGIRDISSLTQAPAGRQPVVTEVAPFDEGMVRRAILKELDRGGQVFFIHNRVQSIYRVAQRLRELVPEARILVAHGQLPGRQLERAMLEFLEGGADVMVCTTIVESGLDIPTVNTLLVDRAGSYGLADLHQLRGRVGRHHSQAFAWFLARPDQPLSEVAERRLRAIEEFSELGAGFRIAMRDMEIRGVGNILGPEQSGHIEAVGYELYCRLLEAAVKQLKADDLLQPEEVQINLDYTAFLPEDYVPGRRQRIELYRRLGRARTEEDFQGLLAELRDRFGPPPQEAQDFVQVARLRALLERHHLRRLDMMPGEGLVLHTSRLQRLVRNLDVAPDQARILGRGRVLLVHPGPFRGPGEILELLESCLEGGPGAATGGAADRMEAPRKDR